MITTLRRASLSLTVAAVMLLAAACNGPAYRAGPAAYSHDYYYYPHTDVYYRIYTGDYYYRSGDDWLRVRVLPRSVYLDPRVRVTLRIDDPRPYVRHREHRAAHPPPPGYRFVPDRDRDRAEREHNLRRHEEYRERYGR